MSREQRFIDFFSNLSEKSLLEITNIFSDNARFKDPFNDVVGINKISTIFSHMFETTESPRFIVNHSAQNSNKLFIQWDFSFERNNKAWLIEGSSMVTFGKDDLVIEHIDFWDPAEQVYEKITFLRPLILFLKSKLKAS